MKTYYVGVAHPSWLAETNAPLFVSRSSFYKNGVRRKSFPRAKGPWALDSGGFSEIKAHGKWTVSPEQYVEDVHVFSAEVGKLQWAAIMDWMCEEQQLTRTGLKVKDHQRLSTDSYLTLKDLAPRLPWTPVLQGWTLGDYEDHVEHYARAGVDLRKSPLVGVGSVCRRQATLTAGFLFQHLASEGLKLHGFGLKTDALVPRRPSESSPVYKLIRDSLVSADSQSWSLQARFARGKLCVRGTHPESQKCSNCLAWALEWREDLLERIRRDDELQREIARSAR